MRKIKQLVYKFPTDEDISEEINTQFFGIDLIRTILGRDSIVFELGIQAKPKTIFEINDSKVIIGSSGTYELTTFPITSLICSNENSLENSRIIIDMVYEEEE